MTHFLNASQLAEACVELDLQAERNLLEAAAQIAGEAIARKLNVAVTIDASTESGFAGLCVGFGPSADNQPCPMPLREYDPGSDWMDDTRDTESEIGEKQ